MKIPYQHVVPERTITIPAETIMASLPVQVPERTVIVPAQTVTGEVEVADPAPCPVPPVPSDPAPGGMPGPLAGPFVARLLGNVAEMPMAGDVTDKLKALLPTGKMILLNDGTAELSEPIRLPSGTRIEGSGDTRNHTVPETGSVFSSKLAGSYKIGSRSFRKPAFTTDPNLSAGGIILAGFGIKGLPSQPLLQFFGIGNGSKLGPLRLIGGKDQIELFDAATDHSAAYYGVFDTIFADGMAGKFCVVDAGAVKGGKGPIYLAFHHCDVQGTRGADFEIRNGQGRVSDHTTAGNLVLRDSVFHGGPPVHINFVDCEEMRLRHDAVITTSPVVVQSNRASLRGLITASQFGGQQKSGYIVKKPGWQLAISTAMQGFLGQAEIEV